MPRSGQPRHIRSLDICALDVDALIELKPEGKVRMMLWYFDGSDAANALGRECDYSWDHGSPHCGHIQ